MNIVHKLIFIVILVLIMIAGSGCTALALETGNKVYTHLRGDFVGIVPNELSNVHSAATKAIQKLPGFSVTKKELNSLNGRIMARDNSKREVQVDFFRTEYDQTRIQIRIGALGDKIESVRIYDQIKQSLLIARKYDSLF